MARLLLNTWSIMLLFTCYHLSEVNALATSNKTALSQAVATRMKDALTGSHQAKLTTYELFPRCCEDKPNYDSEATTEECDEYSACDYWGETATGSVRFEDVKSGKLQIVAFFDKAHQGDQYFQQHYANKRIEVSAPGGINFQTVVMDTCGNEDCDGCCSENADTHTGYLVDIGKYTADAIFGGQEPDGEATFEFI